MTLRIMASSTGASPSSLPLPTFRSLRPCLVQRSRNPGWRGPELQAPPHDPSRTGVSKEGQPPPADGREPSARPCCKRASDIRSLAGLGSCPQTAKKDLSAPTRDAIEKLSYWSDRYQHPTLASAIMSWCCPVPGFSQYASIRPRGVIRNHFSVPCLEPRRNCSHEPGLEPLRTVSSFQAMLLCALACFSFPKKEQANVSA